MFELRFVEHVLLPFGKYCDGVASFPFVLSNVNAVSSKSFSWISGPFVGSNAFALCVFVTAPPAKTTSAVIARTASRPDTRRCFLIRFSLPCLCAPNGTMTRAEYRSDYSDPATRKVRKLVVL